MKTTRRLITFFVPLFMAGCQTGLEVVSAPTADIQSTPSLPSDYFAQLRQKMLAQVDGEYRVLAQTKSLLSQKKTEATLVALEGFPEEVGQGLNLEQDCYADIDCFDADLTITLAEEYGADWENSLIFLDSYFSEARSTLAEADEKVRLAETRQSRLEAYVERDQVARKIYGDTLGDAALSEQDKLTKDLAVGWIRSQVRRRDIEANGWLRSILSGMSESERRDVLRSAWAVIQHSDRRPALQYSAVRSLKKSGFPNDNPKQWAMLVDRLEINLDRPQVYGTQVRCIEGEFRFSPTIDDTTVNERRVELGLDPIRVDITKSLGSC